MEPSHSFILFIFGWYSMWQIFMYCYFGHRIRALHASVLNAAYQSQWVHGSEISRSAAIMIATVASCPNSISQIGSPFFSLSMETFTSVSKKHIIIKNLVPLTLFFFSDCQRCNFLFPGTSSVQAGREMSLGSGMISKTNKNFLFFV